MGPHFGRKIRGPLPWIRHCPSSEFLICCSISKRFCLHWKAFDLLNKMRYILWTVALLEACDVTDNGRHLGRHLGFYQELEISKTARNGNCLTWIITHKWALCMILATRFTFIVEKSWKKHTFSLETAWPPAAYYVISRYHRNWSSLNLSQNACEG